LISQHSISRIVKVVLAVIVGAVVLSSCRVDGTVQLKMNRNGSGEVTVTVLADKKLVDAEPGVLTDFRSEDLLKAGWIITGPETLENGSAQVIVKQSFRNPEEATNILSQINGPKGPLKNVVISRAGKDTNSTFTLTGQVDIDGGLEAFVDDGTLALLGGAPYAPNVAASGNDLGDAVGINFEAILPGDIEETTGLERGGVITWRVAMDGAPTDLSTVTQSLDIVSNVSRVMSVVVRALLVLWVLGMLVLAFVVYNANARRRTPRI
jgi:hypothetical protein